MVPSLCTNRCLVKESQSKSTALFRLLTQTVDAPKKEIGLSESQTHKKIISTSKTFIWSPSIPTSTLPTSYSELWPNLRE